jgi:hypothetical protein
MMGVVDKPANDVVIDILNNGALLVRHFMIKKIA